MQSRRDILKVAPVAAAGLALVGVDGLRRPTPAQAHDNQPSFDTTSNLEEAVTQNFLNSGKTVIAKTWIGGDGNKLSELQWGSNGKTFAKAAVADDHIDSWVNGKHHDWHEVNVERRRLNIEEPPSMETNLRGIPTRPLDIIRVNGAQYRYVRDVESGVTYLVADLYTGNLGWRRVRYQIHTGESRGIVDLIADIENIENQISLIVFGLTTQEIAFTSVIAISGGTYAPIGAVGMVSIAAVLGAGIWYEYHRRALVFRRLVPYFPSEEVWDPYVGDE